MQVQSAAVKRQSEADKRPDESVLFLFGLFFSPHHQSVNVSVA